VAAVELPPVAAAAQEGVTPVVAAASATATAQRFAAVQKSAVHVAAVDVAAVHVAAVHAAAGHVAAVQKSAPAEVAVVTADALAVGAPAAADTAFGLAQLHQGHVDWEVLQAAAHQRHFDWEALQAVAHQRHFDWEALQAAAHQMGSAAMGIAAEHALQSAQGLLSHCEGQRRGLEGGKTGAEQGLPVDGRKKAGRFGEQGDPGGMKSGSGGPASEAVQNRDEHDWAELAQRIETDSCNDTKDQSFRLSKDCMA